MEKLHFRCSIFTLSLQYCFMVCLVLGKTDLTTDESALIAFKSSITMKPYNLLANWSNSSFLCSWVGVTCDARHGRVHKLNLGDRDLQGTIPPQLGNLSFLVHLDLGGNSFHGQLPMELMQLRRLKMLNLSHNRFNGEIPTWIVAFHELQHLLMRNNSFGGLIPPSLSNLSKLETLDWNYNFIEGIIPPEIGQLPRLKILDIAVNNLFGTIPLTISNISSLERLVLSNNSLSGDIPKEIANLPNLEAIILSYNKLSGSIPSIVFNISELRNLDLGINNLTGSIPLDICDGVPKLEFLQLDKNELSGQIPLGWHQCKELQILSLAFNRFRGHIPREIGNITMLVDLYFGGNDLEGTIPQEMVGLNKFEDIDLQFNKLSGTIPLNMFNISTLKGLYLSINYLSGTLPLDMGSGLPNLESLYLHRNEFSGKIPDSISNASKLVYVALAGNKFHGVVPSTFGNLRDLQQLRLYDNNLTIGGSSSKSNFLTSLTSCKHLKILALQGNPLHTKLFESTGNLSNSLEVFWADSCSIDGMIPLEIGNLSKLIFLSLSQNNLNGLIPSTIDGLQQLQILHLEENKFEGTIVNELCEIRGLSELYLTKNKLSGALPTCLGNLTLLRKLYLDSNYLHSEIPSSFWFLKDILEVNISSNAVKGEISLAVENLRALILLDLSRNQISGTLPPTITSLQTLQNLSLADNKLEGSIPESISELISLELLDFSQNSLSGMIPKSLESLVHLKYINLSYNKLEGEIPSGGPFANFTAQSFLHNKALCGRAQLQVPPCDKKVRQSSTTKLLLIKCILPILVSTILVVSCITFLLQYKRKNAGHSATRSLSTLGALRKISYYEILQATNRFDESNLIGKGSTGSVFKGMLSGGVTVAFKIFDLESEVISRSFDAECEAMRNLRHRNLIKIISSCSNVDFKCLVMEFMLNGSLEKWLYSYNYHFYFLQRLNVMIDVSSALEYLHHGCPTPVIHHDLKPSNILLDEDMVAHVSDFGISKLLEEGQSKSYTMTMPTVGYIAPECGSEGIISRKGDVYSYGIILLEMFTRKRPTDDMFVGELSLKSLVSESMYHDICQVIDCNLLQGEEHHKDEIITSISSIFELALNCCSDLPEARMNMIDVVVSLNKIKTTFTGSRRHFHSRVQEK